MSFELEGILHKKFDVETKGESFQVRDFVVRTDGMYPQFVKFQLTQDRCNIVDQHNEGEPLKVFFDLRGREWQGKYFTNLNAWKVEKPVAEQAAPPAQEAPAQMDSFGSITENDQPGIQDDLDDLPF